MNRLWSNDEELFAMSRRELFTAVVGDIMDKLHLRHQFLPPHIRPLDPSMIAVGRAMTILEADIVEDVTGCGDGGLARPFGLMLDALDDLKPNEIYICTGASPHYALWGELMSVRAMQCGAAGAVLNGYSRDTRSILDLGFPTFSMGSYAQDQAPRGKVVDFRVPIQIGGTKVHPGDIVFGDIDGVCVVPATAEADVFCAALEKARGEKLVRNAIEAGMTATDAFKTYGIM